MSEKEKYIRKHYLKVHGLIQSITDHSWGIRLVLTKGSGKKKRHMAFSVPFSLKDALSKHKIADRIRVDFVIESKQYGERWYTNLLAKDIRPYVKRKPRPQEPKNDREPNSTLNMFSNDHPFDQFFEE